MPNKPASPVQTARIIDLLHTRRRHLQLKQHALKIRLARVEAELSQIEAQIAALAPATAAQPTKLSEADAPETFSESESETGLPFNLTY